MASTPSSRAGYTVLYSYNQGDYHAMQDPQPLNEPNLIGRYVCSSARFRYSSVVNLADSVFVDGGERSNIPDRATLYIDKRDRETKACTDPVDQTDGVRRYVHTYLHRKLHDIILIDGSYRS